MNSALLTLWKRVTHLLTSEQGQDLVEYALIVSLMCFASTAAMKGFAQMLSTVISSISANIAAS